MATEGTVEFDDVTALSLSKSGKAILCRFKGEYKGDGRRAERWIPVSVIHDDSEVWQAGHSGKLVLPEWFAIKEGMV